MVHNKWKQYLLFLLTIARFAVFTFYFILFYFLLRLFFAMNILIGSLFLKINFLRPTTKYFLKLGKRHITYLPFRYIFPLLVLTI